MGHPTTDVWKKKRPDLSAKRDALFKKYSQSPDDHRLSLEIKKIDDEVAECPASSHPKSSAPAPL
jgi:hypothetical protein